MVIKSAFRIFILCVTLCNIHLNAQTDEANSAEELAKRFADPVTGLISTPFKIHLDFNLGPNEGFHYHLNMQPIVPVSISKN